jgi:zinc-binding alcohol dehydrogenase family protein
MTATNQQPNIPEKMKAIAALAAKETNTTKNLVEVSLPTPVPTHRDVLVKIKAISINPVDTKIRKRHAAQSDDTDPKVLGWDAAGTIVAVGDEVTNFKVGDDVWYAGELTRQGSNAEYQLVDERLVSLKPKSLNFADAAAMPLTILTAWEMLFDRLQIKQDDNKCLLIIGAAGGVGSIMIQLAKLLTQKIIIGTASRPESEEWLNEMGCHHIINHRELLVPQIKELHLPAIPTIVSLNHTDQHLEEIAELIAPQGKFGLIDDPLTFDITAFKPKSVSIHWEFMYTRSLFKTDDMSQQHTILKEAAEMIDSGRIKSTMNHHFGKLTLENLKAAHEFIETHSAIGKVVLEGF